MKLPKKWSNWSKNTSKKKGGVTIFFGFQFQLECLAAGGVLNSKILIGVFTETDLDLAVAFAKFIPAKSLHPHFHLLTKENTLQIQKKGFEVFP